MKHKPEEYRHIRAWGRHLHSFNYYIEDQQWRASEEHAPLNAIFKGTDGTWHTVDGIASEELKTKIEHDATRDVF
jgi:hypothetical protein